MGTGYVLTDVGNFPSNITTSGMTASTTQTQGNGALTSMINEISTVGSMNDTVTLPTAVAGRRIVIINNASNDLRIFPASGDNLGTGVNIAVVLQHNQVVTYSAYDTTNWIAEASTAIKHAVMFDSANTDVYVISAQSDDHMYHSNGI